MSAGINWKILLMNRVSEIKMKVVILSKYNEGLIKEVNSLVKIYQLEGYIVETCINDITFRFLVRFLKILWTISNQDHKEMIFYNLNYFSPCLLLLCRIFKVQTTQCFHEPGMANKLNYGVFMAIRIIILELIVLYCTKITERSVVFSKQARNVYLEKFNETPILVPLLPYIENNRSLVKRKVKQVVFIGRIHKAKNLEKFLELVENPNLYSFRFVILSKNIDSANVDPRKFRGRLKIISQIPIADSLIEEVLTESMFVFKLDKNMMQSGLVAQASRYQCVPLVNNILGFTQEVEHLKTAIVYDPENDSASHLAENLNKVADNFEIYAESLRNAYNTRIEQARAQWLAMDSGRHEQ